MRPASLDGVTERFAYVVIHILPHMTRKAVYKVNGEVLKAGLLARSFL